MLPFSSLLLLLSFLCAPWSTALYHERFGELRSYLHYFLLERRLEIVAILDRIIATFTTQTDSDADEAAGKIRPTTGGSEAVVRAVVAESPATAASSDPFLVSQLAALLPASMKEAVQRGVLRFLRMQRNHLPHYTMPPPFYPGPQAKPKPTTRA